MSLVKFPGMVSDGLRNLVANLNTERDKQFHNEYDLTLYNDHQLLVMYRGSWLPRKIVDVPAFDSVRRWRTWNQNDVNNAIIRKEERRLMLPQKTLTWLIASRLFGGAALYYSIGSNDPSVPINPMSVGKGGLRAVNVITKRHISPGPIEEDIDSPYFGRPAYYNIMRDKSSVPVVVHPSRLTMGWGNDLPAGYTDVNAGWGDSVLTSVVDAIKQSDSTMANLASLVFEAKTDVVKIPDLMTRIADKQFEKDLISRFTLAAMSKGNNGMLILDSEEDYTQKKMSFSTLPEVADRFYQSVSGAADIPMTRLFGMSPGGMNSTGDSDVRNYYDAIQAIQTLQITPAMGILDEVMIRSAFGYTPRGIDYEWETLWQANEQERAEIMDKKATTISTLRNANVISEKAGEAIVSSEYSEKKDILGIKEIINKHPITEGASKPSDVSLDDAAPMSLYVSRKVLNADEIISWAKSQGFKTTLPADDLHVTVMFSRVAVDWMKIGQDWSETLSIGKGGPRLVERFGGGATVLLFSSWELSYRHGDMRQKGAKYTHEEYQPHITISYEFEGDINSIEPYTGPIELGPEIFEEIDEDIKMEFKKHEKVPD